MIPVTIVKQIEIAAKATTVWRYVGTERGLREWWGFDITLEEKQGGCCEERSDWQGRPCHWRGQVTDYQPPYQLSLLLHNMTAGLTAETIWPAWTTIVITLTEHAGRTQVKLVQALFDATWGSAVGPAAEMTLPSPAGPVVVWNQLAGAQLQATQAWPLAKPMLVPPDRRYWLVEESSAWLRFSEKRWEETLQVLSHQVMLLLPS
ncbi:MAG: SRPBCC domain-containing protein [Caldilineaceae bacterium]|nr:SRPBCC domain-containing protein [Caldilineaceae bacterium]